MKLLNTAMQAALTAALYFYASWALAATDNATLTVGKQSFPVIPAPPGCYTIVFAGYSGGAGMGSYSPTGLTGGATVTNMYDFGCVSTSSSVVGISGFLANPGNLWLISVTCNGVTRQASAASYNYNSSSSTASWQWAGTFGFNALSVGTNVSCSITHN